MLVNKEYTIPIHNHGMLKSTIQIDRSPMIQARISLTIFAFQNYLDFITEKKYKIV